MRKVFLLILLGVLGVSAPACKENRRTPAAPEPPPPPPSPPVLTAPTPMAPTADAQLDTLRPTLTVNNGTSDQAGTRTYEFQISDKSDFSLSMSEISSFTVVVTSAGVAEGANGTTSFAPAQDLQPTTRLYWRARMTQSSVQSAWSTAQSFRTRLVGFSRPGQLYDPLIHGVTVGTRVGSTTFLPGEGIRLNAFSAHVRYLLPRTVQTGEFSMDVKGLRANGPGDKTKVFGMQEGQEDFITNLFRVDAQYRGSGGFPPNAITFRAMFGAAEDKAEPPTSKRFASVFRLDPATIYHWRGTTRNGYRLEVLKGGIRGTTLYNYFVDENDPYRPNPHYAYLGTPPGRSGVESASIPGAIYSNVWIGDTARPASLGTALLPLETLGREQ